MIKPSYIYHRCFKAEVGWFEAYGWEVVRHYVDQGVDMARMRHVDIEEEEEEDET